MQRIQVVGLLIAAAAALAGCSPQPPQAPPAPSVAALLHDGDLYARTLGVCRADPAQHDSEACVNVSAAGLKRGLLPCFNKGQIDHACLDAHGYRRN